MVKATMTGLKAFFASAIVALALVTAVSADSEDPCEGADACTTGYGYDYEEILFDYTTGYGYDYEPYASTEGESPVISVPTPPSVVVVQPDGEETAFLFDREAPDDE